MLVFISSQMMDTNECQLQTVMNGTDGESMKMGMKVNIDKTEVQLILKRKTDLNIVVQGYKLKQVEEFVYLA